MHARLVHVNATFQKLNKNILEYSLRLGAPDSYGRFTPAPGGRRSGASVLERPTPMVSAPAPGDGNRLFPEGCHRENRGIECTPKLDRTNTPTHRCHLGPYWRMGAMLVIWLLVGSILLSIAIYTAIVCWPQRIPKVRNPQGVRCASEVQCDDV